MVALLDRALLAAVKNSVPHSDPDICTGYRIGDLYKRLETSDGVHSIDFILLRITGLTPANNVIGTTNVSSTGMDGCSPRYDNFGTVINLINSRASCAFAKKSRSATH